MEISLEDAPPFKVLCLRGDVDMHVSPQVRQKVLEILKGNSPLLIDLAGVSYMDSSGVASLVEGFQMAKKQGLEFGLVGVAPAALNVLKLARLDKVFPLYATREERLARGA